MYLAPNIIHYPTVDEKEETASHYRYEKEFPGIIGIFNISIEITFLLIFLLILFDVFILS